MVADNAALVQGSSWGEAGPAVWLLLGMCVGGLVLLLAGYLLVARRRPAVGGRALGTTKGHTLAAV